VSGSGSVCGWRKCHEQGGGVGATHSGVVRGYDLSYAASEVRTAAGERT
jgi:hypothetical protein